MFILSDQSCCQRKKPGMPNPISRPGESAQCGMIPIKMSGEG